MYIIHFQMLIFWVTPCLWPKLFQARRSYHKEQIEALPYIALLENLFYHVCLWLYFVWIMNKFRFILDYKGEKPFYLFRYCSSQQWSRGHSDLCPLWVPDSYNEDWAGHLSVQFSRNYLHIHWEFSAWSAQVCVHILNVKNQKWWNLYNQISMERNGYLLKHFITKYLKWSMDPFSVLLLIGSAVTSWFK